MPEVMPHISDIERGLLLLDNWEDRYRYVVGLGRSLPALAPAEMTEGNRISRCVSQVWIVSETPRASDESIVYRGQSDTQIVQGLLAIVLAIYSGRRPRDIVEIDAVAVLTRLGLQDHLTSQRSDGVRAMIARCRADAAAAF